MTVTFDKVKAGEYLAKTRFGTFSIQSGTKGNWYVSEPGNDDWSELEYSLKEAKDTVERIVNRNVIADEVLAGIDPPLKAGDAIAWSPYSGQFYFGTFRRTVRLRGEQFIVALIDGREDGHETRFEASRLKAVREGTDPLREQQAELIRQANQKAADEQAREYLHKEADHRVLEAIREAIDRGGIEAVIEALEAVPARYRFDDLVTLHYSNGIKEQAIFRRYEDDGRVSLKAALNDWEFTVPADAITRGWDADAEIPVRDDDEPDVDDRDQDDHIRDAHGE